MKMDETISYYNQNADAYFLRTVGIDYQYAHANFLKYLQEGAKILDAGCGSGRDTKAFLEKGYAVLAFDASLELVKLAKNYTGTEVLHMSFDELDFENEFHGVWSSASLVHVSSNHLLTIMKKIKRALKDKGVWFLSVKHGSFEGFIENRFFHFMTEKSLENYIQQLDGFQIMEMEVSKSFEKGSDAVWVHCLLRKIEKV